MRKLNYLIPFKLLVLFAGIFCFSNSTQAQFMLDSPFCANFGVLETVSPPDKFGRYIEIFGTTAIVSATDEVSSYGYIYENDGAGNWVEGQRLAIPDPNDPTQGIRNQGDVTIQGNFAVVCPKQIGLATSTGKPTLFVKDGSGIWNSVAEITIPYTGAIQNQRVVLNGNELILGTQIQGGGAHLDAYTITDNGGGSYSVAYDYQIFTGSSFRTRPNNSFTYLQVDGDDLALWVSPFDTRIYSKDGSGQYALTNTYTQFNAGPILLSDGLFVLNDNAGAFLFRKDGAGNWIDETGEFPSSGSTIPYMRALEGDYAVGTSFNGLEARIFEYNGSAWVQQSDYNIAPEPFNYSSSVSGQGIASDIELTGQHLMYGKHQNSINGTNTFVTFNCPGLPSCSATTPADGDVNVFLNTTISWGDQIDATGYRIALGTSPGAGDIVSTIDLGDFQSFTPPTLPLNTTVYATLSPYNVTGTTNCEFSFVTQGDITYSCPPTPTIEIVGINALWTEPSGTTTCTTGGACDPPVFTGFTVLGTLNDKAYYISDAKSRWLDAFTEVQANGGNLATIPDQATNDFLQAFVPADEIVHIGINDQTTEGTLEWMSGEAVAYTNFRANEPSDAEVEDFGLLKVNGRWRLRKAGKRRYWMEIPCTNVPCAGPAIAGFTYVGGEDNFNYYLSDEKEKYDVAQAQAALNGGTLGTIRSQAANDLLAANNAGVSTFMGINDAVTEGTYVWDSGETVAFENWANNYPDVNAQEDFAAMRTDGEWNMNINKNKFYFMEVDCVSGPPVPSTVTVTQTGGPLHGVPFPPFTNTTITVSYELSDDCGNVETCTYDVRIFDPGGVGYVDNSNDEIESARSNENIDNDDLSTEGIADIRNEEVNSLSEPKVAVFPNPASQVIYVVASGFNGQHQTIMVCDILGRNVLHMNSDNNNEKVKLNTSNLVNGIYSVIVVSDLGERDVQQIVINK